MLGTARHVTLHLGQQHFPHEAQGTGCLMWARWAEARNRRKRGTWGQGASHVGSCISLAHRDTQKKLGRRAAGRHVGPCWCQLEVLDSNRGGSSGGASCPTLPLCMCTKRSCFRIPSSELIWFPSERVTEEQRWVKPSLLSARHGPSSGYLWKLPQPL